MKKFVLFFSAAITFACVSVQSQETVPTRSDYNQNFEKSAVPGSYEEISLTKERLILLKEYEPITKEKIQALVYLRIISQTQGHLLSTKCDDKGMIVLPEFEAALADKKVPLALVQKVMRYFPGPYTKTVLEKMLTLGILTSAEKDLFSEFITQSGFLPGIAPEQPVIVVKDSWEGLPLNSYGMINTEKMLEDRYQKYDSAKLHKLVEKHQRLLTELENASETKHGVSAKDLKKARAKQEKEVDRILSKMLPMEKEIAELHDLLAYLYLAGVMQNRYESDIAQVRDIDRDSSLLLTCLLRPASSKETISEIKRDRLVLTPVEQFICIDKTLLWVVHQTTFYHKRLAEHILRILLDDIGHPPFDAPTEMWLKWWQMQQKSTYTKLVGVSKIEDKQE